MAQDLALQLLEDGGPGVFVFFSDDGLTIGQPERFFKTAAEPPELARITERWEIRGRLVGDPTSDLVEDTWDEFQLFLARVDTRTGTPRITGAQIVRDPSGSAFVERALSSVLYQRIQVVEWEAEEDPDEPGATFRGTVPIRIVIEADRVFADGNGIVEWEQTCRNTYRNALHTLEHETRLTTIEGVSAVTAANSFAGIDIVPFGARYTFSTNGPNGIDFRELDCDTTTVPDRIATEVIAISRIQQWGISTGGIATPGNSVNDILFEIEETIEGVETRKVTRARAEGPGAFAWVLGKKPAGSFFRERTLDRQTHREAEGEWEELSTVLSNPQAVVSRAQILARVSGGFKDEEFVPLTGGQRPRLVVGPFQVFRLEVEIRMTFRGVSPQTSEMPFPPILGSPWRLNRNQSSEDGIPQRVSTGQNAQQDEWERSARLIYESSTPPTASTLEPLRNPSSTVNSYFL